MAAKKTTASTPAVVNANAAEQTIESPGTGLATAPGAAIQAVFSRVDDNVKTDINLQVDIDMLATSMVEQTALKLLPDHAAAKRALAAAKAAHARASEARADAWDALPAVPDATLAAIASALVGAGHTPQVKAKKGSPNTGTVPHFMVTTTLAYDSRPDAYGHSGPYTLASATAVARVNCPADFVALIRAEEEARAAAAAAEATVSRIAQRISSIRANKAAMYAELVGLSLNRTEAGQAMQFAIDSGTERMADKHRAELAAKS